MLLWTIKLPCHWAYEPWFTPARSSLHLAFTTKKYEINR